MFNISELQDMGETACELLLKEFNLQYRLGDSKIPDLEYDMMIKDCCKLYPENSWFNQTEVEPEPELIESKTTKLPQRMLSTNKTYTIAEIEK